MNAPTPRETADHAELAAMKPSDVLAVLRADRLPECSFDNGMTWVTDDVIVAETFARAADALEYLLSEIAALRGERDGLIEESRTLKEQYDLDSETLREYRLLTTQVERQRDEAVAVIKDVDQAARLAASMNDAGYTVTVERTATHIYGITAAFLATQGADQ